MTHLARVRVQKWPQASQCQAQQVFPCIIVLSWTDFLRIKQLVVCITEWQCQLNSLIKQASPPPSKKGKEEVETEAEASGQ